MTIHLPVNLENSVREAVHKGQFASLDDAMAQAVSLLLGRRNEEERRDATTLDELHQQMLADGLITRLPDDARDVDDNDAEPVRIEGEPLSETIIRERR